VQRDASHSDTQTEHGPPAKPEPPRAIPTKRRRLAYKTPTPFPSTSSGVIYESSTPLLSIKREFDDDDVSTDDLQIEPYMLDYGAMTGRIG